MINWQKPLGLTRDGGITIPATLVSLKSFNRSTEAQVSAGEGLHSVVVIFYDSDRQADWTVTNMVPERKTHWSGVTYEDDSSAPLDPALVDRMVALIKEMVELEKVRKSALIYCH